MTRHSDSIGSFIQIRLDDRGCAWVNILETRDRRDDLERLFALGANVAVNNGTFGADAAEQVGTKEQY